MGANTGTSSIISLPKGGGAVSGIGEKFSPDLHTGTGNFTIPIALPPGRNGFQPQLSLVYSTGNGNGPFGSGWNLSIPGVSRKTSKGIPRYDEAKDVFILSGAEDLVPVEVMGATTRYRPRTEGLFAKIPAPKDCSQKSSITATRPTVTGRCAVRMGWSVFMAHRPHCAPIRRQSPIRPTARMSVSGPRCGVKLSLRIASGTASNERYEAIVANIRFLQKTGNLLFTYCFFIACSSSGIRLSHVMKLMKAAGQSHSDSGRTPDLRFFCPAFNPRFRAC
jgi:hypothetical protein